MNFKEMLEKDAAILINKDEFADEFIYKLLHTKLDKLVEIKKLKNYTFKPNSYVSAFGKRSDIVNKNVQ